MLDPEFWRILDDNAWDLYVRGEKAVTSCQRKWNSDHLLHQCSMQPGHTGWCMCHCGVWAALIPLAGAPDEENPGRGGRGEGGAVSSPEQDSILVYKKGDTTEINIKIRSPITHGVLLDIIQLVKEMEDAPT